MPGAVFVDCSALNEVAHQRIRFVLGLTTIPAKTLARIVLVIADLGDARDLEQRVGEVVDHASSYGVVFSIFAQCDLQRVRYAVHFASRTRRLSVPSFFRVGLFLPRSGSIRTDT
jgi:hypothetical protein